MDMSHAATCLATLRKVEDISTSLATRNATFCCRCRLQNWGVKAMLHEAIFFAFFCCETSCKKGFTCDTPVLQPATATKCCVASCKKSRNILCVTCTVHRNLQGNFVKIRQSEPVFCSQEISSWRRKSCKQFPPWALQVAKKYCERVTPPLQLAMFFSRHRCETS